MKGHHSKEHASRVAGPKCGSEDVTFTRAEYPAGTSYRLALSRTGPEQVGAEPLPPRRLTAARFDCGNPKCGHRWQMPDWFDSFAPLRPVVAVELPPKRGPLDDWVGKRVQVHATDSHLDGYRGTVTDVGVTTLEVQLDDRLAKVRFLPKELRVTRVRAERNESVPTTESMTIEQRVRAAIYCAIECCTASAEWDIWASCWLSGEDRPVRAAWAARAAARAAVWGAEAAAVWAAEAAAVWEAAEAAARCCNRAENQARAAGVDVDECRRRAILDEPASTTEAMTLAQRVRAAIYCAIERNAPSAQWDTWASCWLSGEDRSAGAAWAAWGAARSVAARTAEDAAAAAAWAAKAPEAAASDAASAARCCDLTEDEARKAGVDVDECRRRAILDEPSAPRPEDVPLHPGDRVLIHYPDWEEHHGHYGTVVEVSQGGVGGVALRCDCDPQGKLKFAARRCLILRSGVLRGRKREEGLQPHRAGD